MHEAIKTQVSKLIDAYTDNEFQFVMLETIGIFNDGKITNNELQAFYRVAKVINPISWAIFWRQNG